MLILMVVRRGMFWWQIAATFAVPIWLVIGRAVFIGTGIPTIAVALLCPAIVAFSLLLVFLGLARVSVRKLHALSWIDCILIAVWHGLLIATGFMTSAAPFLLSLALMLAIVIFWVYVGEWFVETKRRVKAGWDQLQGEVSAEAQRLGMWADSAASSSKYANADHPVIRLDD